MKPTKYIIAGHSKASPGAKAYNGKMEHEYTTELQGLVVKHLKDAVCLQGTAMEIKTDNETMASYDVRNMINTYAVKGSVGIDIHFNNNNTKATGTEVIISERTSEENKQRASRMVKRISECLGIKHRRRVHTRDWIFPSETHVKELAILDKTKIPMLLIEVCFLNEHDLPKYEAKKNEVARIIAEEL